jgi:hypothetical protein
MKALTLYQPHATLVALGAKTIETRSYPTSHRGSIAICAAKKSPNSWQKLADAGLTTMPPHNAFSEELENSCGLLLGGPEAGLPNLATLPSGVIVALATLVDVRPCMIWGDPESYALAESERAFGVYGSGRYAWFFEEILPLRPPYVPVSGHQRLWNLATDDYLAALDLAGPPTSYTRGPYG